MKNNTENIENTDNNIRTGIFGTYARKHIEETYPEQMDILKLIDSLESFIETSATIGSDENVKLIQRGKDSFSAKELANNEMVKYIDANIKNFA